MVNIKDSIIPDPIMIAISSHSISNIGMTNINPAVNIITNNNGQPHIPNDISQWTGVMSDWNGKSNSEVLKKIGATEQGSYAISGNLLNGFINSSDALGFDDWYIPSCPQMSLVYMRMVDINDILYLIGGKMFQASTEAYMTSSECNDRNYWSVSGYGQVGVSDKRNPKRIRLIRDL